jgi:steroid delta-isomerase-like uncharacterized protein
MQNFSESKQAWLRYIESWNDHDVERILDNVSDDFIYDECPMTMHKPVRGKIEMRKYLTKVFTNLPDIHISLTSLEVGYEMGFSESTMKGTFQKKIATICIKRKINVKVACRFNVRNNLLTRENLYWDRGNTLKQLGLIPAIIEMSFTSAWK